ncbi:MAG: hypothetical protein IME99_04785 [Proteobacteria bacterium]|nr:hypothetical protein [Pseudomonadota bacterium]
MSCIEITITCPVCETDFQKKASEMPDGTVVECPKCNEKTTIQGDMFTNMDKSVEDGGSGEQGGHSHGGSCDHGDHGGGGGGFNA